MKKLRKDGAAFDAQSSPIQFDSNVHRTASLDKAERLAQTMLLSVDGAAFDAQSSPIQFDSNVHRTASLDKAERLAQTMLLSEEAKNLFRSFVSANCTDDPQSAKDIPHYKRSFVEESLLNRLLI
jgi:hypothetical protein